MKRVDLVLAVTAIVGAALFFTSVGTLWPLADVDLTRDRDDLVETARSLVESAGYDLSGYRASSRISIDPPALEYVARAFGEARAQEWLRAGLPIVRYDVRFKRHGDVHTYGVELHPSGDAVAWWRRVEDDDPAPAVTADEARALAERALGEHLAVDLDRFAPVGSSTEIVSGRTDHRFVFERKWSEDPELREEIRVAVAGNAVSGVSRDVDVPAAFAREQRRAAGPEQALQTAGFALGAVAVVAAFFVFLTRLKRGTVRLGRSAALAGFVLACLVATWSLDTFRVFAAWEPLWPSWISTFRYIVEKAAFEIWMTLVLLALVAAGDALDREHGRRRGDSLWALARGRFTDPAVGLASLRGTMLGFVCGGVLAAGVLGLAALVGTTSPMQPRGFFFYALNSASPAFSTLLYFLNVALLEELGYRFFAGTWIEGWSGRRSLAIAIPAAIYGLTHTGLDFLPAGEPFWARAVVMTLVGAVWGIAFFRFDALTVILSHWTADLFIFNWPRIASGKPTEVAAAVATIAVPLVPAVIAGVARLSRPGRRATARSRSPRDSPPPPP